MSLKPPPFPRPVGVPAAAPAAPPTPVPRPFPHVPWVSLAHVPRVPPPGPPRARTRPGPPSGEKIAAALAETAEAAAAEAGHGDDHGGDDGRRPHLQRPVRHDGVVLPGNTHIHTYTHMYEALGEGQVMVYGGN